MARTYRLFEAFSLSIANIDIAAEIQKRDLVTPKAGCCNDHEKKGNRKEKTLPSPSQLLATWNSKLDSLDFDTEPPSIYPGICALEKPFHGGFHHLA